MDARFQEFMRFCIVGIICTVLDMALFCLLRIIVPYQIALVGGYLISLVVNYMLTIRWTFRTRSTMGNIIGIMFAHLFNLFIIRMGLMWIFTSFLFWGENIAYVPTLAISVTINFFLIRYIVKR